MNADRSPLLADTREAGHDEGPGGSIGPYRILQTLGEGGFGTVYEADQEHPVKRRVALKVIKLGMDTREVIARFDAERQALALMDHPHIAHVLDAGMTASGRPYFVMELVRGVPITTWCDRHKLTIERRLELFEQVCHAVQHAHTKGVIHRDLKPSNVLVHAQEDLPVAKVIDFGIAKAISGRLTDKTLYTAQQQMIGTPLYMSPEQAEGSADIDTRSDIYSLGVMLYELLTGTTPFELSSRNQTPEREIQRIICEVEPPAPSACLTARDADAASVASLRRVDARTLGSALRGELDWIVMKAIDKERTRRYETANALALDIRRHLSGLPVLAAPPSRLYRMRKFVRRHRVWVSASLLAASALLAGVIGFAWQARIASQRAAELEQVASFQAEMLDQVDPSAAGAALAADLRTRLSRALAAEGLDEPTRARMTREFDTLWQRINATDAARELIDATILRPAAQAVASQFAGQPLIAATLDQALAQRYRAIGLYEAALPLQQRALDTRRRELGDEDPETLKAVSNMAVLYYMLGRLKEAEPYFAQALELRRRALGPAHQDTLASLNNMGVFLQDQGRLAEAEPYYREALQRFRESLGGEHEDTLRALANYGNLLQAEGKLAQAEASFREQLETSRRSLGAEHADTLASLVDMGEVLHDRGRFDEARRYYTQALEGRRRVLGGEHPETLLAAANLGVLARDQGRVEEAESLLMPAFDGIREAVGGDHPEALYLALHVGALRVDQGRAEEALALLRPLAEPLAAAFAGAYGARVAEWEVAVGRALALQGDHAQAASHLEAALERYRTQPGPAAFRRETARATLVALLRAWHAIEPGAGHDRRAAEVEAGR